jgi:hypothetical protein
LVVHTYNSSYLGGPVKNLVRPQTQPVSWLWWPVFVILPM